MILTADIGNTNITLGVFQGDSLVFISRLATQRHRTAEQYAIELDAIFRLEDISSDFDGEFIDFGCQSELVQSFYMASGKTRMCLGMKKVGAKSVRFLCDGMDKAEQIRLYPEDELVLAIY